jgi:general secretion pathway protein D
MLESVDISPTQVMIEATIAEVTLNDELKFGVRWFFEKGKHSVSSNDAAQSALDTAVSGGFSYLLKSTNFKVAINALNTISNVDVISNPTLTVLENKKALLQVGDEVPILTQQASSNLTVPTATVNSVSYRNTGIILGITPRVSESGQVILDIEQEVSSVANAQTTANLDSPTIQQRRVKTTVTVNSGETLVLAGLVQDNTSRARDQTPLLGDVPLLGNAFKTKDDKTSRTELMIAITPQVLRDSRQIAGVAAEFRDKLNLSTRPQRTGPPDQRETLDRLLR